MKFVIGKKIGMSQLWDEQGRLVAVTDVSVDPCVVTQVKTNEKDGYSAVQLGTGSRRKITKALKGHFGESGTFKHLREFRLANDSDISLKKGDTVGIDQFEPGDAVEVIGISKGKGFQGVVKRHGFHGSPASHGHKDQLRMPGSIGATEPARVFKGTRMGGRMGGVRVTSKGLEVVAVDADKKVLRIKGTVPGARNGLVQIVES